MSARAARNATCGTKKSYPTMKDARDALFSVKRRKPSFGFLRAYKCPYCIGYHFGHAGSSGGEDHKGRKLLALIDTAMARDAKRDKKYAKSAAGAET